MADVCSSSSEVCSLTTCSLCLKTLDKPKTLSCFHTFCLQCLHSYCEKKNEKKELSCPLCSEVVPFPPGGIENLPGNFCLHDLLDVENSLCNTRAQESVQQLTCGCGESCRDSEEAFYCIDCNQNMCEQCSVEHKKAKSHEFHKVLRGFYSPSSSLLERRKLSEYFCENHPDEERAFYCFHCQMITCGKCLREHKKKKHDYSNIEGARESLHEWLEDGIIALSKSINMQQKSLEQLEVFTEEILKRAASAESKISQRCDELINLIQSHRGELMKEVGQFKEKTLKEVGIRKERKQRQLASTENHKMHCKLIMNRATDWETCHTAQDLYYRAMELFRSEDPSGWHALKAVDITLTPTPPLAGSVKNFIGELDFGGTASCTKTEEEINGALDLTAFHRSNKLENVMRRTKRRRVTGMTVVGSEIFVVRNRSQVDVYRSDDFRLKRCLIMSGSNQLIGLVSCAHYKCLYAVDTKQKLIYRFELASNETTNWSVGGTCYRLSVTKCYNVIATRYDIGRIQEYSTYGNLIREINLECQVLNPLHSVQLSTGNFVVCCESSSYPLCIVEIDEDGCVLNKYDRLLPASSRERYNPMHMAVDRHDNVLIAGGDKNRVELLSRELIHLGDIVCDQIKLNDPYALHYDATSHRLYVGEWKGGRMLTFSSS